MRKATLLLSLFFFISLVAGQPTSEPSKYYGTVQYEDGSDIGEVRVKAVYSVNGDNNEELVRTSDGNYELVVEEEQNENITQVRFYINDTFTGETANFSAFDSQQVNLTVPKPESDTTQQQQDTGGSGGSGGGGGGGFAGLSTTDSGNTEPVAGFTWDTPVRPGEQVTLYASGSFDPDGNISSYRWSIGATGSRAQTVFDSPGSYPVTLTVVDGEGAETNITKDVVVTRNDAPVASFDIVYSGSNILTDVRFNASGSYDSDGNITQYSWSFGEQGVSVVHSFQDSGNVTLTVVDNEGRTDSVTKQLNERVSGDGDGG
ncbi:MAG: PKD domain-containing protein [Candidatus Nanosalina sp.]